MRLSQSVNESAKRFSCWLYRNTLRRLMPVKEALRYSGVKIDFDRKFGDQTLIPGYHKLFLSDKPDYEKALITGLEKCVEPSMNVTIVGGGMGVTAVIAARLSGESGSVTCYEASEINCRRIRETARRNELGDRVNVKHGLVGPPIVVYHDDSTAPSIGLDDLSNMDVLELDCEGSEKYILSNMSDLPQYIVVETHGAFGAPTVEIDRILQQRGYMTEHLGVAEPMYASDCMENDIKVIFATRDAVQPEKH